MSIIHLSFSLECVLQIKKAMYLLISSAGNSILSSKETSKKSHLLLLFYWKKLESISINFDRMASVIKPLLMSLSSQDFYWTKTTSGLYFMVDTTFPICLSWFEINPYQNPHRNFTNRLKSTFPRKSTSSTSFKKTRDWKNMVYRNSLTRFW